MTTRLNTVLDFCSSVAHAGCYNARGIQICDSGVYELPLFFNISGD